MTDPVKPKRKVTAQISYSLSPSPPTFHSFPSATPSPSASTSTGVPKVRARVNPNSIASSSSSPRPSSPINGVISGGENGRPRLHSTSSSTSLRSVLSGGARVKSPTLDSGGYVPPVPPLPRDGLSAASPKLPNHGGPLSPPLTSPSLSSRPSTGQVPKVKAPVSVKVTSRPSDNVNSTVSGSGSSRSASPIPPPIKARPPISRADNTPDVTPNRPPSRSANRSAAALGGVGMARVKSSPISDLPKVPPLPITPTPPLRARARSRGISNASELPPPSPSALEVAAMPSLSPNNLLQVSPTNNPGGWTSRVASPHDHPRAPSPSPRHLSPSPTRAFFDPPSTSPSRAESPQHPLAPSLANRTIPSSPVPSAAVLSSFSYLQESRIHANVSAPTTPLHSHAAFLPDYGASQGRVGSTKKPLPPHPHVVTNPGPPTPSSPILKTVELPVSTPRGSNEWPRGSLAGITEGGTPTTPAPGRMETPVGMGLLNRHDGSRLSGSTMVDSMPQSPSVMDEDGRQKPLILNLQGTPPEIAVVMEEGSGAEAGIDVVLEAEKDVVKEARINRKIADLEISNASLLAINRSLEATKSKQRAEILKLRRALRESLAGGAPQLSKGRAGTSALLGPSPLADGTTAEGDEEDGDEDEFDPEAEAELEARWEKISQAMSSILRRGQEAIAQTGSDVAGSSGRVLGWDEVQSSAPSEREGSATPDVWQ